MKNSRNKRSSVATKFPKTAQFGMVDCKPEQASEFFQRCVEILGKLEK
jgi:hypothetical protein